MVKLSCPFGAMRGELHVGFRPTGRHYLKASRFGLADRKCVELLCASCNNRFFSTHPHAVELFDAVKEELVCSVTRSK